MGLAGPTHLPHSWQLEFDPHNSHAGRSERSSDLRPGPCPHTLHTHRHIEHGLETCSSDGAHWLLFPGIRGSFPSILHTEAPVLGDLMFSSASPSHFLASGTAHMGHTEGQAKALLHSTEKISKKNLIKNFGIFTPFPS